MSGGKYTQYAAPKSARNDLLNKLFVKEVTKNTPPMFGVDETTARTTIEALATAPVADGVGGLIPSDGVQAGGIEVGSTVYIDYRSAPDVSKVAWDTAVATFGLAGKVDPAGGPANPYAPDITSPGPDNTAGTTKTANPNLSVDDMKQAIGKAGYVPSDNTKNPTKSSEAIVANNVLTKTRTPGSSGG